MNMIDEMLQKQYKKEKRKVWMGMNIFPAQEMYLAVFIFVKKCISDEDIVETGQIHILLYGDISFIIRLLIYIQTHTLF